MRALQDFLSTDYGLMSLAGILFMLGMGVFYVRYFLRNIARDAAQAEREAQARAQAQTQANTQAQAR